MYFDKKTIMVLLTLVVAKPRFIQPRVSKVPWKGATSSLTLPDFRPIRPKEFDTPNFHQL